MDEPVKKGVGINPAERYLVSLAEKSFLSLFSYPNVYYAPGKEFADLLVVCGNHVLIFQDKWSEFPDLENIEVAWKRWFKRTVISGAKQVWGAEKVLRDGASQLYLDAACKTPLPIESPNTSERIFHLIVVTHGGSAKCHEIFGGSGSFMLHSDLTRLEDHVKPFAIGDLDRDRTFVHVTDDTTLNILMTTLDTITDFTSYLAKKEAFLRAPMVIIATGEEELLANYLKHVNDQDEHDFDFEIPKSETYDFLMVPEGDWDRFVRNPQRLAQMEQDKISYMWDELIETFSKHAMEGTQYVISEMEPPGGVRRMEKIMRFMAKESRFNRRVLASSLKEMLQTTSASQRRIRVGSSRTDVIYVFLLFPLPPETVSYEEYRRIRANFLRGSCMVAKLKHPDAKHIVGIATESGLQNKGRSEDAIYLDGTEWSSEMQASAEAFQAEWGVLKKPNEVRQRASEYPEVATREEFLKNPRNKPCPCGSEKKFKKCCGPKGRKFYK